MHKTRFRLYLKKTRSAIVDLHKSRCLICFALATLLPNTTRYDKLVGVCNGRRFGQVRQAGCNPKKLHGISNSHRHFPKRSCGHFFTERREKIFPSPNRRDKTQFSSQLPRCPKVETSTMATWRWRWKIHGKWIILDWWRLRGFPKNIEIFSIENIGDPESSTHFPENKVISKAFFSIIPFRCNNSLNRQVSHVERDVAPISSALLPLVALDSCKTWRL